MRLSQAKTLILHEGRGEDGVVNTLRLGRDPGPARMGELIGAIRVLFRHMQGQGRINRDVAAALFALGTEVPAQVESWGRNGGVWRADLVQRESVLLRLAVESVFEGEWLADDSVEPAGPSVTEAPACVPSAPSRHTGAGEDGRMAITVESRRKKLSTLEKRAPGALILDLTSRGEEPWVRFSPFYPHGGIPVPHAPGVFAQSVEGLWQGLKVFEHEDIDPSRWQVAEMRGIKRAAGGPRGKVLGHRLGPGSTALLGYRDARYRIYLPAYRWVLQNRLAAEVDRLRHEAATRPLVLLDYETNGDVEDLSRPLSHAALVKAHLEGRWPAPA